MKASTISMSFRCTKEEKNLIHKAAEKKGMTIQDYILFSLDENLPLEWMPYSNKLADRKFPMGARVPLTLRKKILRTQKTLSTDIRKIKIWEIIIYCCIYKEMEVDGSW